MPSLTHDTLLRELRALANKTDAERVASAFVASLSSPPTFWRAPLIALAAARAVPSHRPGKPLGGVCAECGLDPEPELEPTHERGQCLPGDLAGALSALRAAKNMKPPPAPSKDDVRRLTSILALVGELPAAAREGQLSLAIAKEKLVVGNKYDRRHVIETLGACGILQTPEHPGFTTRWTSFAARQDRPNVRVEVDPPIAFWTAGHGVSKTNAATWFGHLGVKVPKTSLPRADAVAAKSASAKRRDARSARATELAMGDAVAFRIGRKWIATVVVGHHADRAGTFPIVEVLDWSGADCATAAAVKRATSQGERWGVFGLWKREAPDDGYRVVASDVPAPKSGPNTKPRHGLWTFARMEDIPRFAKSTGLV